MLTKSFDFKLKFYDRLTRELYKNKYLKNICLTTVVVVKKSNIYLNVDLDKGKAKVFAMYS